VEEQRESIKRKHSLNLFCDVGAEDRELEAFIEKRMYYVMEGEPPPTAQVASVVYSAYKDQCQQLDVRPNSGVLKQLSGLSLNENPVIDENTGQEIVEYNFAHCGVGNRGIAPLLIALCEDRTRIVKVSLRDCAVRTSGGRLVATFLGIHPTLARLDISSNPFAITVVEALLKSLNMRRDHLHHPDVDLQYDGTYISRPAQLTAGPPCGHRNLGCRRRYSLLTNDLDQARSPSPQRKAD